MKTALFYYTGSGNSLWVARQLQQTIEGQVSLHSMVKWHQEQPFSADAIGVIFPVHIWGLPYRVINFINNLNVDNSSYQFALAVNAGQVAATLLQLRDVMQKRGLTLDAGYSIEMPSNYIPWGGPGPVESQMMKFEQVKSRLKEIAYTIEKKYPTQLETGPWWQRLCFSAIYKMTFNQVSAMDKSFWADEKCNGCGICQRVCPASNIKINGKPEWLHQCEQCFACLQWCPTQAIQFGKKTAKYERYHHPEITVQDMINSAD